MRKKMEGGIYDIEGEGKEKWVEIDVQMLNGMYGVEIAGYEEEVREESVKRGMSSVDKLFEGKVEVRGGKVK